MSRGDRDKKPFPLSITQCVKAALDLTENELFTGNDISKDLMEDVPKVLSNFNDLTRLHINLLLNAAAANEKLRMEKSDFNGEINVSVSYDQRNVFSSVTDNGIGMNKDKLEQVLEQLSSSERIFPFSEGGLYESFGIVKKYGAKILAKSDGTGHGSSFVVSFPRARNESV